MKFPFDIPSKREFDVVGFGTNAVDHLVRVPHYPEFNSKVELTSHTVSPGGEVASTLAGLARLGHAACYVGRFGDDPNGALGMDSLRGEGVNVDLCELVAGAVTQIAYILIDEQSGERTVIWKRDPATAFSAGDAPTAAASSGRILHLTPHDTEACIEMATAARASGTIVSADVDNLFEGIERLMPLVDVCLMSADLASRLAGTNDIEDALRRVASTYGNAVAGVTLGEAGSLIYCNAEFIRTPASSVPGGCIDTTGAGDAFRTGFLHGMLTEAAVEETAELANAVAALKCRRAGARDGLPSNHELTDFLKAAA